MEQFKKTINNIEFEFTGFVERDEDVCRVRTQFQEFKMTTDDDGNWMIRQQVPGWVKELEQELGDAIDEAYN